MSSEICFDAPEITTNMGIMIDARVSIVTVSKLIDVKVTAGCKCPDGRSGTQIPQVIKAAASPVPSQSEDSSDDDDIDIAVEEDGSAMVQAGVIDSSDNDVVQTALPTIGDPQASSTIISKESSHSSSSSSSSDSEDEKSKTSHSSISKSSTLDDSAADAKTTTDASSMSDVSMTSQTLLQTEKAVNITGTLASPWKQENVLGKFKLSHEDQYGRPIYVRENVTSSGKQVYLYHIHESKKWRVGPSETGTTCWLFVTSKVPRPELIDQDATAKGRTWHEHSTGKWLPVTDMTVTAL